MSTYYRISIPILLIAALQGVLVAISSDHQYHPIKTAEHLFDKGYALLSLPSTPALTQSQLFAKKLREVFIFNKCVTDRDPDNSGTISFCTCLADKGSSYLVTHTHTEVTPALEKIIDDACSSWF